MGLTVIGWSALVAARRGPTERPPRYTATPLDAPPAPGRLPAAPEFAHTALAATHHEVAPRITVPLRLRNAAAVLRKTGAGVAIHHADTGGEFTWLPLAGATERDGIVELAAVVRSRGDFVVTVAVAPRFARHGYITRTQVHVADSSPSPVELDANAAEITFVLPAGRSRSGPFRIVRDGDPQWASMQAVCAGMMIEGQGVPPVLLGTGTYDLLDPLVPERRQRFVVSAPAKIEISAALAVARADRP